MTDFGNTETTDLWLVFQTLDGNLRHLCYKITGDGSSTTFKCSLSRIMSHAVGVITAAEGYNPAITYSGNQVIYGTAPLDDVSHFLHLWGI